MNIQEIEHVTAKYTADFQSQLEYTVKRFQEYHGLNVEIQYADTTDGFSALVIGRGE